MKTKNLMVKNLLALVIGIYFYPLGWGGEQSIESIHHFTHIEHIYDAFAFLDPSTLITKLIKVDQNVQIAGVAKRFHKQAEIPLNEIHPITMDRSYKAFNTYYLTLKKSVYKKKIILVFTHKNTNIKCMGIFLQGNWDAFFIGKEVVIKILPDQLEGFLPIHKGMMNAAMIDFYNTMDLITKEFRFENMPHWQTDNELSGILSGNKAQLKLVMPSLVANYKAYLKEVKN